MAYLPAFMLRPFSTHFISCIGHDVKDALYRILRVLISPKHPKAQTWELEIILRPVSYSFKGRHFLLSQQYKLNCGGNI